MRLLELRERAPSPLHAIEWRLRRYLLPLVSDPNRSVAQRAEDARAWFASAVRSRRWLLAWWCLRQGPCAGLLDERPVRTWYRWLEASLGVRSLERPLQHPATDKLLWSFEGGRRHGVWLRWKALHGRGNGELGAPARRCHRVDAVNPAYPRLGRIDVTLAASRVSAQWSVDRRPSAMEAGWLPRYGRSGVMDAAVHRRGGASRRRGRRAVESAAMSETSTGTTEFELSFHTHPSRYRHWRLEVEGPVARLVMDVDPRGGLRSDYELKLNSYDLGVDIELNDAVMRLRFEHPEVRVVLLRSGNERCFCAGANIPMLGSSAHAFKVNFCKYTNETRLGIEDASRHSGQHWIAAIDGACAGGGYELALACDEIVLVDDGSTAVSLPEVPLLGVLPGTGGLTRLVDKRKVRRDLADWFCTTEEGVRGKRALQWGLVDALVPRSRFWEALEQRAAAAASEARAVPERSGPGVTLDEVAPEQEGGLLRYRFVSLSVDEGSRVAELTVRAPQRVPSDVQDFYRQGASAWVVRAFRELDDALLRLRLNYPSINVVVVRTRGEADRVLAYDRFLHEAASKHWFAKEAVRLVARVLKRMDLTSKSFFAMVDEGSCFAGSLFELALAADRSYMLEDEEAKVAVALSPLNAGALEMSHGISRLQARFWGDPKHLETVLGSMGEPLDATEAQRLGLVTWVADDIDWEDDTRIAIEERASISPDALTGMEASLRFPGPETMESKIFARLSAWQNWIFQRPNAVGPRGALTSYGTPQRPSFEWTRC